MAVLTAALTPGGDAASAALIEAIAENAAVEEVFLLSGAKGASAAAASLRRAKIRTLDADLHTGAGVARVLDEARGEFLLLFLPSAEVRPGQRAIERLIGCAADSGAGLVYSDFKDEFPDGHQADHPLVDYCAGSIRDSFDFGSVVLLSVGAARRSLETHGAIDPALRWAGLYDLRLKLSIDSDLLRIPEPLYARVPVDARASGERQFDYVDPRQRQYQREMEDVATAHLKRVGAYLAPRFEERPQPGQTFPVRASVIIPVRNRERTIRDAVASALSQHATFDFNVIVIDNHSADRTTEILTDIASKDARLVHLVPRRTDLGIGGCWNEAIYSSHCGEYALQLDSDDLYADADTLERVVAKFEEGPYAMVIGSYTIVNFDLQEIPPGLIDHREWTRENGRNNALRINGLGAPRAFYTPVLRQFGLPNVSYGEDYGTALRISRQFEIGRIYESLYFARRWEGNSDAALPLTTANRYDAYKDHLRGVEIAARKRIKQR